MEYKKDHRKSHFSRGHRLQREFIALLRDNELDYEFASPEEPISLWELEMVLSNRFNDVTEHHCHRIQRAGNTFFLVDEDSGQFLDQWTAVRESELPNWEEKYKNSRRRFGRSHQVKREFVALIPGSENGLDYEFASPECPMSLFELNVVLSTRFEEKTDDRNWRLWQEGNTFFLIDEYTSTIIEQWTAVHRSSLPIWEEVLA